MTEREEARVVALWVMGILASVLFAVGLLSPLTPSEGSPGVGELVAFVGIPLGLLACVVLMSHNKLVRALLLLEAGVIIAFTGLLLRLHGRL